MTNYSIAEEYTLPSLGKVYTQKIDPVVKLRSMTTEEEMKRLAPSDRQYKNLCEIIDDCIVNPIGISVYDMCIADYQFLLHKLRIVTYGPEYKTSSICPLNKLMEIELPKSKNKARLMLQAPRMIDDITLRNKELKRKSKGVAPDETLLLTLSSIITTIDGKYMDPVKKEDFIRNLPMMDTNYIMRHAQKLVESFGIDSSVVSVCSVCGLDYTSSFRFTSEFFGPSVDI